ncbi:MAG: serine/threonine protein kinase [Acidobacteria bacterium]|nr:serine/threonine protein kinase [Acidobacteriota bacterium]
MSLGTIDQPSGTVLDGKYRLEAPIGLGGFGVVYRAIHLGLGRAVAVKILHANVSNATAEELERFRLEGVSTCRIDHPNAISILDFGITADGFAYLVMELLDGRLLVDELREKLKLSLQRATEIIVPVCDVLAEAHSAGIVHRDIKPDNIYLHQTKRGEVVKVLDFGIAKLSGSAANVSGRSLTGAGIVMGTPEYMAPERVRNKAYDGRSDVYSLGIMMYQMLSGRLPFESQDGDLVAVMWMQANDPPPSLRQYVPEIPVEIESLIFRALSKQAVLRPTAEEFADELIRITHHKRQLFLSSSTFSPTVESPTSQGTSPEADPVMFLHREDSSPGPSGQITQPTLHSPPTAPILLEPATIRTEIPFALTPNLPSKVVLFDVPPTAPPDIDRTAPLVSQLPKPPEPSPTAEKATEERVFPIPVTGPWDAKQFEDQLFAVVDSSDTIPAVEESDLTSIEDQSPEPAPVPEPVLVTELSVISVQNIEPEPTPTVEVPPPPPPAELVQRMAVPLDLPATVGEIRRFVGHSAVTSIAFAPNGRHFVSAKQDKTMALLETETGKEVSTFGNRRIFPYRCAVFSPDSCLVAVSGTDDAIRIYDLATGQEQNRLSGHQQVTALAFSPDGKRLLSGSQDSSLCLWELQDRTQLHRMQGHIDNVANIVFASNGSFALSIGLSGDLHLWNLETGQEVQSLLSDAARSEAISVRVSIDGRRVLGGDSHPGHSGGETKQRMRRLEGKATPIGSGVAISPDRTKAISSSQDTTLRLWDLVEGREAARFLGHGNYVTSVAISADGTQALSGSEDRTIRLWDLVSGQELVCCMGHKDKVYKVAFLPGDRHAISCSYDGTVRLWGLWKN